MNDGFKKLAKLGAVLGGMVPGLVLGELVYDGVDIRQLTTSAIPRNAAIVANVCCMDKDVGADDPIAFEHIVGLNIRMKKGSQIKIYNLDEGLNAKISCDGKRKCYPLFTVAETRQPLNGLKIRYYCQQDAQTSLNRDPDNSYIGFSILKGQVTVDGTDQSPISCMPD